MIYVFRIRDTGELFELSYSSRDILNLKREDGSWKLPDGRIADRDFTIEHSGAKVGESRGYPYYCDASGVQPGQIEDARAESVRNGVPTDFTKDGRSIIRDYSHRKAYYRSLGLHDRNGFT